MRKDTELLFKCCWVHTRYFGWDMGKGCIRYMRYQDAYLSSWPLSDTPWWRSVWGTHSAWSAMATCATCPRRSSTRTWWQTVRKKLHAILLTISLEALSILCDWWSKRLYLLLSIANEQSGSSNGKMFSLPWHDRIRWRLEKIQIHTYLIRYTENCTKILRPLPH